MAISLSKPSIGSTNWGTAVNDNWQQLLDALNTGSVTIGPLNLQNGDGRYLRLPSLTTAQRNALTAIAGMIIYNSDTLQCEQYINGAWAAIGTGSLTSVTASAPLSSSGGASPNVSISNQSANLVLAGPSSGGAAAPAFRSLVAADIGIDVVSSNAIQANAVTNSKILNATIDLAAKATGTLPVANGGTNSSTALNNNRMMLSSLGKIVEAGALSNGQLFIGSSGSAPVAANLTAGSGLAVTNGAGSISIALGAILGYASKTADYTVLTTDNRTIFDVDASGAAATRTITLPAASSAGAGFVVGIRKSDNSSKTVTIATNSASDSIAPSAGGVSQVLNAQYASILLLSTGTGNSWIVLDVFDYLGASGGVIGGFTSGAFKDIASITVTPGVWEFSATFECEVNGSTLTGVNFFGISKYSGNTTTDHSYGTNFTGTLPPTGSYITGGAIASWLQTVTPATQAYYSKIRMDFSAGNPTGNGSIRAIRVR